jgi:plastocyanin
MSDPGPDASRRGVLRSAVGVGAAGAGVGAAQTAEAQESGGGTKEVAVGPGGELVFDPETIQVTPGTTVKWVWEGDNHNVVVESQPDDADWEGQPPDETYDTGHEYEHTFETLGTYDYFCQPHKSVGMVGTVEVVESISTPEPSGPTVPDGAKTLGVATSMAMVATLGLAFFFLKYGGDYEE